MEKQTISFCHSNFAYNYYKLLPNNIPQKSITSTHLLIETLKNSPTVLAKVVELQNLYGIGNIVYSVKNNNGIVSWELYFYGFAKKFDKQRKEELFVGDNNSHMSLAKFCYRNLFANIGKISILGLCAYSIDLVEGEPISKLNLFYITKDLVENPLTVHETNLYDNGIIAQGGNSMSYSPNFSTNEFLIKEININRDILVKISKYVTSNGYLCNGMIIFNTGNEIGICLLGITTKSFVKFLKENKYNQELITYVEDHYLDIDNFEKEISLYFDIKSDFTTPTKTSFYGLL